MMAPLKAQAIVLRHTAYRDSDRMLTLFSPELGRIEAKAAGVLKPKSALIAGSELFAVGEYMLYQRGGRNTVTGFALEESYYPLRGDYDRLRFAAYLLSLCEAVVMPGEGNEALFVALRAALAYLAYGNLQHEAVAAAFLLVFAQILGFRPQLTACVRCGRPDSPHWRLDDLAGGLVCSACASDGQRAEPVALDFLRRAQRQGLSALEDPDCVYREQALAWMRRFVEARMEKRIRSAKLI